jgi:hypothetical protein
MPASRRACSRRWRDRRINIQAISTSEIKVSVLIHADYTELAVRVLHTAYGLDAVEERHDREAGPRPRRATRTGRASA